MYIICKGCGKRIKVEIQHKDTECLECLYSEK
jgi:hypothetical protein